MRRSEEVASKVRKKKQEEKRFQVKVEEEALNFKRWAALII